MEGDEHSHTLLILQEQVKTKLAVFLQAEFDRDTHRKDADEQASMDKLSSAKKDWLEAKGNLAAFEKNDPPPALAS